MSEFVEVTPELLAGFLDEAPEYLVMLEEGLLSFEDKADGGPIALDDPEDKERMNCMFRAAHSLKGLGATMGFMKIRDLTHLMETLFDHIRMGKRLFEPHSFEAIFTTFDTLRALVDELVEPPDEPVEIAESLASLQAILDSPTSGSEPDEEAPADPETQSASPIEAAAPVREDGASPPQTATIQLVDDPELMQSFIETTLETVEQLNQKLLKLEEAPDDLDILNEIFRCAHNIKGASGAVGYDHMFKLTHDMETILDRLRSQKQQLEDTLLTALFSATDELRTDIDLLKTDGNLPQVKQEMLELFNPWLGTAEPESSPQATPPDSSGYDDDDDDDLARVTITFDPESEEYVEAEIQAYLVHNKLSEFGELVKTDPDLESLDPEAQLTEVRFFLRTEDDLAEIEEVISKYAIKSVKATPGGQTSGDQAGVDPTDASAPVPPESTPTPTSPEPASASLNPALAESKPAAVGTPPPLKPAPSVPSVPKAATAAPTAPSTAKAKAKNAPAATKPHAPKVGETIRVDLERLDQLMNLGGELVINKARFSQIESRLSTLFSGKNLGYLVDDITERINRLNEDLGMLAPNSENRKTVADLSEVARMLSQDFEMVRNLVDQVHDLRGSMNDFSESVHGLTRISEGIQKRIMETRMVAIGPLFQRFRRVVRDISKSNGKKVDLLLKGEATELDKRMIDELGDPLTHMVRNSVDHGLETPEERVAAGKPEAGQLVLDAYHRGRYICIEVRDDGKGVDVETVRDKIVERELASLTQVEQMTDKEVIQYVFRPGFSTAKQVTDLSGRGMGMDIVITKIEDLNGTVEIDSTPGKGTVVTIKLPLTLAIINAVIARIGGGVYAIPLEMVAEIISVPRKDIQYVQKKRVVRVRDKIIPIALFEQIFGSGLSELQSKTRDNEELTLVVLVSQEERIGLIVDELIGQEDVVIKSIATNYRNVPGVAGASIMGDGAISLILDVAAMMNLFAERIDSGPTPSTSSTDNPSQPDSRATSVPQHETLTTAPAPKNTSTLPNQPAAVENQARSETPCEVVAGDN